MTFPIESLKLLKFNIFTSSGLALDYYASRFEVIREVGMTDSELRPLILEAIVKFNEENR